MPGAERAEIYFITAMMILILVLCVAAVYFFFRQYKKEMREKEEANKAYSDLQNRQHDIVVEKKILVTDTRHGDQHICHQPEKDQPSDIDRAAGPVHGVEQAVGIYGRLRLNARISDYAHAGTPPNATLSVPPPNGAPP